MRRRVVQQAHQPPVGTVDAQHDREKVMRSVTLWVGLGFVIAASTTALGAGFAGVVFAGVATGIGAAMIAGSDYPTRRAATVALAAAMLTGVALGLWLGGLAAGLDPDGPDAGQGAWIALIASTIPVVLGALLGYMIGRERRIGRRS